MYPTVAQSSISKKVGYFKLILALLPIIGSFIFYSRFIFLFRDAIATLGVMVIFFGLLCALFIRFRKEDLIFVFFVFVTLAMLVISQVMFVLNTGLVGEWRSIGNFCGLFLVFPFVLLGQTYGPIRMVGLFYALILLYCITYIIFSIGLEYLNWFTDVKPVRVILNDPIRGPRIFACGASLFFLLYVQFLSRFSLATFIVIASVVGSLFFASSRIVTVLGVAILPLVFFDLRRYAWLAGLVFCCAFLIISISSMLLIGSIKELLTALDPETLSLRVDSVEIARDLFVEHLLLGVGVPSDSGFYHQVTGKLFFPEDLGGIGILSTFGIAGGLWLLAAFGVILRAMKLTFGIEGYHPHIVGLGYTGLLVLFMTMFWPTLIYGDGAMLYSLLFALLFFTTGGEQDAR